jgi:hypothetical protein
VEGWEGLWFTGGEVLKEDHNWISSRGPITDHWPTGEGMRLVSKNGERSEMIRE